MALSTIRSIPGTPSQMNDWLFSHMSFHRDTVQAIYQTQGLSLSVLALDPGDMSDQSWLTSHQEMHNQQNQVLNVQGSDLSTLDWTNPSAVVDWFNRHATEHQAAGLILNIG